ncbi:MAG: SLC13 family permease [Dehalococcoidia bacterium]
MTAAAIVVGTVIVLVAVRRVGSVRLRYWQIVAAGALAMLAFQALSPREALQAIDLEVMLFLFGVFVLGQAAEISGELEAWSYRLFRHARTADQLALLILFGLGGASALLMNDTLAIVGVPVVIALARAHRMPEQTVLLALAFAVTIGSVPSPIGNPQNLLVGLSDGIENPFAAFARGMLFPTVLNLFLAYVVLRLLEPAAFHGEALVHERAAPRDLALARIARVSLALLVGLVATRIVLVAVDSRIELPLVAIALVPAAVVLVLSPSRRAVAAGIDWSTLAFFVGLFVVVGGVSASGLSAEAFERLGSGASDPGVLLWSSAALSQLVSNVPLVALALPVLHEAGASSEAYLALAAGSTVAGNLTILGAASNVIILDNAERRFGVQLSMWRFMRVGVPLTALNLAVYQLALRAF